MGVGVGFYGEFPFGEEHRQIAATDENDAVVPRWPSTLAQDENLNSPILRPEGIDPFLQSNLQRASLNAEGEGQKSARRISKKAMQLLLPIERHRRRIEQPPANVFAEKLQPLLFANADFLELLTAAELKSRRFLFRGKSASHQSQEQRECFHDRGIWQITPRSC